MYVPYLKELIVGAHCTFNKIIPSASEEYYYELKTLSFEVDIKYHWLREHTYENGTVELEHCITEDMVADIMSKALAF